MKITARSVRRRRPERAAICAKDVKELFKGQVSLTSGSVARGMLTFAIPIFFSNLFQQLYNAVDSQIGRAHV